ncbi:MAG: alkaline phosphatase family protein, partial [Candidatus Methylomirabilales bacterium]
MRKRVVILCLDGMDPDLLERWMGEGYLPHFRRLREKGTYSPLQTINPPETAAAWAAFAAGKNPGKTNIFDFVIRDPKTYTPLSGLMTIKPGRGGRPLYTSNRRGDPVWKLLGEKGLRSTILNLPATWPPEPFNGRILTGMGTPDLHGTLGTFTFYSTAHPDSRLRHLGRDVKITLKDNKVETILHGPEEVTVPLSFERPKGSKQVVITWPQGSTVVHQGRLSGWCEVRFPLKGKEALGLCRFCLLEVEPDLKLYCSPIQNHPVQPYFPLTYPSSFAQELYEALGPYRTMGREVDIFSLLGNALSDDVLLEDTFSAIDEQGRMTLHVLHQGQDALLISWFGVIDTTQHGYWRFVDSGHPLYTEEGHRRYGDAVLRVYRRLDEFLGQVLQAMDDRTVLFIVSDHGCANWRRSVHFNTWLLREGYLVLKDEALAPSPSPVEGEPMVPLSQVDWGRTRAYSVGCGKIYVNLRGREGQGIVEPGAEYEALRDELRARLKAWRDPKTGDPVVHHVYRAEEAHWGEYLAAAPDLIVGLN